MSARKAEVIIVGSGAGGATLARELGRRGKEVLLIEKGKYEQQIGTVRDALRFYDGNKLTRVPANSKEGVKLYRTFMAGGSTVVSCGNGTPCLQSELAEFGVHLEEELAEAAAEMNIAPIPDDLLSEGSERIMWASKELGYAMEPMPKFIDSSECGKCGQCACGCARGAKWTALDYLEEAEAKGVDIVYRTTVERVLTQNGRAVGVMGVGPRGEVEYSADVVVLCAGGLGTPVILQRSRIDDAGRGLFMDLLVNTYGITDGINIAHEPMMALVDHEFHQDKGFILSPFISNRLLRAIELGPSGLTLPTRRLLGLMTKTADDRAGQVFADGTVSKPVTKADWVRLREGSEIATEILVKAGADRKSILVSKPQGAHPGGTAAVGEIVDQDLQTEINNLFVCDCSVLPEAPGMPPIVTIVALAKRLAKTLAPIAPG
jgi:choline dehydrogenase-like flavoprotein